MNWTNHITENEADEPCKKAPLIWPQPMLPETANGKREREQELNEKWG